jgi:hypothetical protein
MKERSSSKKKPNLHPQSKQMKALRLTLTMDTTYIAYIYSTTVPGKVARRKTEKKTRQRLPEKLALHEHARTMPGIHCHSYTKQLMATDAALSH